MSPGVPRVLLKARPTRAQLADRLLPPVPAGIELYLAAEDVSGAGWLGRLVAAWRSQPIPADFGVIVEGPLRGLDGEYFDATAHTAANRELVDRLAQAAEELGAVAVNVHAIAPRRVLPADLAAASAQCREDSLPLLRYFADACLARSLTPLLENIPPVARMREQSWIYTPLGMAAADLVWLVDRIPGLAVTLDVSHAGLYLNAADPRVPVGDDELLALTGDLRRSDQHAELTSTERLIAYGAAIGEALFSVHVSNAAGILGEGMAYGDGDFDLDAVIATLCGRARFLVTETLDPDHERATLMRDAQRRLCLLVDRWSQTPRLQGVKPR